MRALLHPGLDGHRSPPKLTLPDLDLVLRHPEALPPGISITTLQNGEYAYRAPGMDRPVRITTRPDYYDEHTESLELWSPGCPVFPVPAIEDATAEIGAEHMAEILDRSGAKHV